ncbi:hypothetical protein C343_05569 [Cryptococcus neoformans C23]|uniref:Metallo-beta-lactamase domain-containing protein n=2 Tax=Cryptococcus neoformans TaxID=5207 RepID=A0A854QCE9_CRYNE|nr:hypothetical protein CNAG_04789 [Cryptococcus neoformans var. grubii H99]AUB27447.1 hypothetical protein CKF44_04789 [Cryptococcus neoformans var. grubii]OWZ34134.1 hypothetical protein C353_05464 [Cryptococcus neoformans var. grubii AD1-83a]OWZ40348.1 hypothetical protein C343_05569 [Cryptococcus neoformans var. grubii C23]OWZ51249.1 hypothetical protein C368_05722 [Cryptococcus neoformans var. grubii 125.91]OXG13682.1 hypothetical protein C361_05822 [Cryptococcus neoformans var. grubii Tu|eukprot:XP_012052207.1 hypothetical protein CNAG_04789 [Cryptococcus neoformans var. grubii H99]
MSTNTTSPPVDVASLPVKSNDPRDQQLVIRQVTPDIITFSVPFTRSGFLPIGGRSTAIRLFRPSKPIITQNAIQPHPQSAPSDVVFVYASHPLTAATKEALNTLGEVKWLVTPDGEHGMYIQEYVDHFPGAQAIGVERYKEQKPGIQWAGLFGPNVDGETKKYGFEPQISLHQVSAHINHELTAIHHPSGTLLEGDMLFNLPPTEQYSRAGGLPTLFKFFGGGGSLSPGGKVHAGMANGVTKNKDLLKKELAPINAAKWDRIIPCHGDVIETEGKVQWNKVWGKLS